MKAKGGGNVVNGGCSGVGGWARGSKDGRPREVLKLELSCAIPMYKEAGEEVYEWEPGLGSGNLPTSSWPWTDYGLFSTGD